MSYNRMNIFQREQLDAVCQVQETLTQLDIRTRDRLTREIQSYLVFREELERFSKTHLHDYCARACFKLQTSACCSKDGIMTFWADVVINACQSTHEELEKLIKVIKRPKFADKCIYLCSKGCLWKVRPLVCAMFICDRIEAEVINQNNQVRRSWRQFQQKAKSFRWPDRRVLFDRLEEMFIGLGNQSPLMYLNSSPGLLRIKKKAGLMK